MVPSARRALLRAALCAAAVAAPAAAQRPAADGLDPAKALTQYSLDAWTADDGLPSSAITAIRQTRDGYLWVATLDGLARYDGAGFRVYEKSLVPGLRSNGFWALAEDAGGALWIGTAGGGLVRMQDGASSVLTTADGLASNTVRALVTGRGGALWIGTPRGVQRMSGGRISPLPAPAGVDADVQALAEDASGALWVGTRAAGLLRWKDGRWTRWTRATGLPHDQVLGLMEDRGGTMWVGTYGGGLAAVRGDTVRLRAPADGGPGHLVNALLQDRQGTLWVGGDEGLHRLRPGRSAERMTARQGLGYDGVTALYQDREGTLWVGLWRGGLNRLRDGKATGYGAAEGLSDDIVHAVTEDGGGVWIGTQSGLDRLEGGRVSHHPLPPGGDAAGRLVRDVLRDRRGRLWIATYGGLVMEDGGRVRRFTTRDGLSNDQVRVLLEDRAGDLWIGTRAGLNRFRDGAFTRYTRADGLTHDFILSLTEDGEGGLWIGTESGGLNRLRDGRFEAWGTARGLASDVVFRTFRDARGDLWVGTNGGLSRIRGGRVQSFTTAQGLCSDVVFQVLEDAAGNLWMTGSRGVFRVNRQNLEEVARGDRPRMACEPFGRADGMKSGEATGVGKSMRAADGRLWFPTLRGVVAIDPVRYPVNRVEPPVHVEEVLADGTAIDVRSGTRLPAGVRRVEFRFSGLSLVAPERVRYRYRLEPFDTGWVDGVGRRFASYTNLPPGRYTFRVTAANNDGVWNRDGAQVTVDVPRAIPAALWAGLAAAFVAGVAASLWRSRARLRRRVRAAEAAAAAASERGRALYEGLPAACFTVAADGTVVAANDFGAGLVGRVPAELAGRAFVSLLHEDDRADAAVRLAECAGDAGRAHRWPARLLRRNGTAAWTEQIGRALPGDGEGGPHVLVLCQDVSAHREAGEALEAARARVAGILESITDGFFALDAAWRFTYVNREAERMLRRARGELLGRTYWECFPRAEGSVFAREYRRVMDERVPAVFEAPSSSLPDVWFQVHAYPCEGGVASYFHDVTSRREAEEALRSLSLVDDLTGLHNRRGLGTLARQQMRVAERTGRGFTLLFLDVDGLKAVNDALGHPAGDRLLCDVAAVLRETFREADVLARLGGDEFAVLALDDGDDGGDAATETVVERLRARVAVHNQVSPRPYALSLSVGAVRYDPARPTTLDDLLRAADARMYEEKRQKQPG